MGGAGGWPFLTLGFEGSEGPEEEARVESKLKSLISCTLDSAFALPLVSSSSPPSKGFFFCFASPGFAGPLANLFFTLRPNLNDMVYGVEEWCG